MEKNDTSDVNRLLTELESADWQRVEKAARELGEKKQPQALFALKKIAASQLGQSVAEVYQAASWAISEIEREFRGSSWLKVDRENPFDQVKMISNQLENICKDEAQRQAAISWWREFTDAIPEMSFSGLRFDPTDARGRTWAMAGGIIYALLNNNDYPPSRPCEEARRCYEEALRCDPKDNCWKNLLRSVTP
jgi:hypothetical protein